MRKTLKYMAAVMVITGLFTTGCEKKQASTAAPNIKVIDTTQNNDENTIDNEEEQPAGTTEPVVNEDGSITVGTANYEGTFDEDRASFDKNNIDIIVGNNLYATQINDWYVNPQDYVGKTVEIEGYYLDFSPYVFVGRKGPSCPYCNGGFVSFEILYDKDLKHLTNEESWIKVQGIIKKATDTSFGEFCYIEALKVEVMEEPGQGAITN